MKLRNKGHRGHQVEESKEESILDRKTFESIDIQEMDHRSNNNVEAMDDQVSSPQEITTKYQELVKEEMLFGQLMDKIKAVSQDFSRGYVNVVCPSFHMQANLFESRLDPTKPIVLMNAKGLVVSVNKQAKDLGLNHKNSNSSQTLESSFREVQVLYHNLEKVQIVRNTFTTLMEKLGEVVKDRFEGNYYSCTIKIKKPQETGSFFNLTTIQIIVNHIKSTISNALKMQVKVGFGHSMIMAEAAALKGIDLRLSLNDGKPRDQYLQNYLPFFELSDFPSIRQGLINQVKSLSGHSSIDKLAALLPIVSSFFSKDTDSDLWTMACLAFGVDTEEILSLHPERQSKLSVTVIQPLTIDPPLNLGSKIPISIKVEVKKTPLPGMIMNIRGDTVEIEQTIGAFLTKKESVIICKRMASRVVNKLMAASLKPVGVRLSGLLRPESSLSDDLITYNDDFFPPWITSKKLENFVDKLPLRFIEKLALSVTVQKVSSGEFDFSQLAWDLDRNSVDTSSIEISQSPDLQKQAQTRARSRSREKEKTSSHSSKKSSASKSLPVYCPLCLFEFSLCSSKEGIRKHLIECMKLEPEELDGSHQELLLKSVMEQLDQAPVESITINFASPRQLSTANIFKG